ncbi:MAG: tetratricopeptide repeat protein [Desulfovibrio sp.]|jgi:predicted Zn-dependent protease|nr:tetratricopeptide repeat protein [Desulfovibrio sp.]
MLLSSLFPSCVPPAAPPQPGQEDIQTQIGLAGLDISPESEFFYYYLLLSEGMRDGDVRIIRSALRGLLSLEPELPVFQDSATLLVAYGELDSARKAALEGLRLHPRDPCLTLILAETWSGSGNVREAIRVLESHVGDVQDDFAARQELARLYLQKNNIAKASALLDSIPAKRRDPRAAVLRARILNTRNKPGAAKRQLHLHLQKNPDFTPAWVELGLACESLNRHEEALSAYRRAAALEPDNMGVWLHMIRLLLASDRVDEAMAVVRQAPPSSAFLLRSALCFSEAGRNPDAWRLLLEAGKLGAAAEDLAFHRSFILQASAANILEAIPPLEEIPPNHRLYLEAMLRKIRILLEAEDFSAALASASSLRAARPEVKSLWMLEAYARLRLQGATPAEALLAEGLVRFPEDEDLLFALGQVQDGGGKKAEALGTMERLIRRYPDNARALNHVGYTLAEENRELDRALALILAALKESPDEDYIIDSLAWVQYRLGRYEEAWAAIRRCLSLGGADATIWEHYAEIALALGKRKEAIRGYKEALRRNPDNAEALRAKLAKFATPP